MKLRYLLMLLPLPALAAITPRPLSAIPDDAFGAKVRQGYQLFVNTQQLRGSYVGNDLNCSNCHMDAGRKANAAPLWGSWFAYPAFRKKNNKINSFEMRLQGCFTYSMNGKAPPSGSPELLALAAYAYWLGMGSLTPADQPVPEASDTVLREGGQAKDFTPPAGWTKDTLKALPGRGYPKLAAQKVDIERGRAVYTAHCALCHGPDGQGRKMADRVVFPPLWGPNSFNWGAGMHRVNTAAGFIHANMPLGQSMQLTEQQAWDVAAFMDSHSRPQDPRFDGDIEKTRSQFHQHQGYYGQPMTDESPPEGKQQ
ncbi:c-type cytochrome [Gallaecimonas sp. GXIMD1310]|uniref:c-type cytochrome n=1 Tax=Gallaecimonas sp. GXIMD1310 TaxID=3131926 RepID=UPI00324B577D